MVIISKLPEIKKKKISYQKGSIPLRMLDSESLSGMWE